MLMNRQLHATASIPALEMEIAPNTPDILMDKQKIQLFIEMAEWAKQDVLYTCEFRHANTDERHGPNNKWGFVYVRTVLTIKWEE